MPHTIAGETWLDWSADNIHITDPDVHLAALREIIARLARWAFSNGDISAEWANKKLAKLGITEHLDAINTYILEAPVTGAVKISVRAADRADALVKYAAIISKGSYSHMVTNVVPTEDPMFASGPEDPDTSALDPDVPTTVDATLAKLREIILLAVVAGPHRLCEDGANEALADFGLAPVPPRRTYTVTRPVTGEMVTTVTAYDPASAERVADWRWADGRLGYKLVDADDTGDATVTELAESVN